MNPAHRQLSHNGRFDWGPSGAAALAPASDVAVVVDVLSFTTTLSVALDRGTHVIPWHSRDETARTLARSQDASLAVGRSVARAGEISLSPATLRMGQAPARLVLPSPNGSTIASALSTETTVCVGASLRNAAAVASWISHTVGPNAVVSVVAAGERWPDGELRPAVEDLWGAGYVLAELALRDPARSFSPEARVAIDAWTAVSSAVHDRLRQCASGQELIDIGFAADVDIAAEVDGSRTVPVLRNGCFTDEAVLA
ncbi:2-phosphosulfolactate phosphatase [Rhodococcoides yunnanense]|uniref:2-phosphosulfolactate phosphatase n=1 Tax=Rhodococcoides yunnanense TaxID=278209 RepID=UPI00093474FB|nr:2-phosphosulfolactate phosphatase [Rhodococcus yunnanensis]